MNEQRFTVSGVEFEYAFDRYDLVSSKDRIVLLKPKYVVDRYVEMLAGRRAPNILDLGIFEGGSAILLALLIPDAKIVGIDSDQRIHTDAVVRELGLSDRIKFHHRTLQQDAVALPPILEQEFGDKPIDMVIDDASHLLGPSRDSFELLWPYLAPGGRYVIEDWNWAHYPGVYQTEKWMDQPALTNLVFELVMAIGSDYRFASRMVIESISASIEKVGPYDPKNRLDLSKVIVSRGRLPTQI